MRYSSGYGTLTVLWGGPGGLTTAGATSFGAQDVGFTHPNTESGSVLGG